jgi:hypothetical protein
VTVLTPTPRQMLRRVLFWIGAAIVLLVVAVISLGAIGSTAPRDPLASDSPTPVGAGALAEVLRQQGVTVIAASNLGEARDAVEDPGATTVLIYDPQAILTTSQVSQAAELSDRVVLIDPDFGALDRLAPTVAQAGVVSEVVNADCDVAALQRVSTVTGGGEGYRLLDEDPTVTGCLGSGDDVVSLVEIDRGADGTLTIVGTTDALSNQFVIDEDNAAYALTLLGAEPTLVWYIPTFEDLPAGEGESISDLSPPWVLPLAWTVALVALVAALWRGRRLGPLVFENLPVIVRSSETMLGRARLYEKSSARLRALDALRVGTVQRLATVCGLPRTATVDEVIAAVAAVTGRGGPDIRELLLDREPATDRELVSLSDDLLTLEADVARRLRPSTDRP